MSTQNGGVEEQKDQRHEEAAEERRRVSAHSITACSSPSPKRFMIDIQTTTITIITRAMARAQVGVIGRAHELHLNQVAQQHGACRPPAAGRWQRWTPTGRTPW